MERRAFLKQSAVLTIMVASGHVWKSVAQNWQEVQDSPAFEPWKTWREDSGKGALALVRAAILSSNAYNSQPWLFRVTERQIELYADNRRNLGAFDPYLREMYLSLGCALENLALAGKACGFKTTIRMVPGKLALLSDSPQPVLVSRVSLKASKPEHGELYEAIPHRHTNREPFEASREVPAEFIHELEASTKDKSGVKLLTFTGKEDIDAMVDVIADCSGKFLGDPEVRRSVQPWLRTTQAQIEQRRDGFLLDPKNSRNATLEAYANLMRTGRLFGLIAVRDRYDKRLTLRAGRVWQRAHLLAAARGLAARPANGAVEIMDHERRLNKPPEAGERLVKFTGDRSWEPTFMFYMGYASVPASASVRRPVQDVEMRG